MKEYRIVCNRRTVHGDGQEYHFENVAPWVTQYSLPRFNVYATKADAMKALSKAIRAARKFDMETQERLASGDRDAIGYWQSEIRIQSRNVSKWTD